MKNITYILGAGASCGIRTKNENKKRKEKDVIRNVSLPLVYEIPERIRNVSNFITYLFTHLNGKRVEFEVSNIKGKYYDLDPGQVIFTKDEMFKLAEEFKYLADQVENHASIDTLAKKLYFTQKKDENEKMNYERIKQLIDLFFTIEHFLSEFDLRYDLFLASVLKQLEDTSIVIPPEINILSWNYDFQFEYSLAKFYQINQLDILRKKFNILPIDDIATVDETKKFTLFRLNGSAGGYYKEGVFNSDKIAFDSFLNLNITERKIYNPSLWNKIEPNLPKIQRLFVMLFEKNNSYLTGKFLSPIKFAWEQPINKFLDDDHPTSLLNTIKGTEILVIIGYSFPTFNRETDKAILKLFSDIIPIYIQVPSQKTFIEIQTKLLSLTNNRLNRDNIMYIEAGNEFFVPYEFN